MGGTAPSLCNKCYTYLNSGLKQDILDTVHGSDINPTAHLIMLWLFDFIGFLSILNALNVPLLPSRINITRKTALLVTAAALIVLVVTGLIVYFVIDSNSTTNEQRPAAIVANGLECADIGLDILRREGSAADAAVAVMLCEGVTCPQSTGLGGGFVLTIYTKASGKVETLIARERAPAAAHENMYKGMPELASQEGGLSIAVPGELAGLWEIHQKYGVLDWADLVAPTIKLCEEGHVMSKYLYNILSSRTQKILANPSLKSIFIDPKTNDVYRVGQKVKRPQLAETMKVVARDGAKALYDGELTDAFVRDIQENGGIVTKEDLKNYKPIWGEAVQAHLKEGATLYTTPAPSSGPLLAFILNVISGFSHMDFSPLSFHRIIETFKYAYAKRTELGDPQFVEIGSLLSNLSDTTYADDVRALVDDTRTYNETKHYGADFSIAEDHGTAHVSIISPNGDAVAITGTINYILGSYVRSGSTGIILNDEMDDFSIPDRSNVYGVPPSPSNYIKPGKIPMSSMCPAIVVDAEGNVQMSIGAAGGTKITTSVAYVIMRQMFFNETLLDAMFAKRIHHQLVPMQVQYEAGLDGDIVRGLLERGHAVEELGTGVGFAAVTAISAKKANPEAFYDPRRGGSSVVSYVQKFAKRHRFLI